MIVPKESLELLEHQIKYRSESIQQHREGDIFEASMPLLP